MGMHSQTLVVSGYEDLRDRIASSGVFSMTDCNVEIRCPDESDVEEIQKMTKLIESLIHVTDVKISSTPEDLLETDYKVIITEDNRDMKRTFARKR